MKNKIGWCDMTWNPAWGCRNHCEYCYARRIASFRYNLIADKEYQFLYWNRKLGTFCTGEFANKLRHFVPTFIESHFARRFPKKPQRIFVGSMSEIEFWREDWMRKVIEKIKKYPQHIFMFLTQHPEVYARYLFPANCWLGVTVVRNKPIKKIRYITIKRIIFLSIEPLLEEINHKYIDDFKPDWVIIGAETGNRKGKVIPNLDWVLEIVRYCEHHKIPVYIKDNLTKYYAECRGYKQFPEGVEI